MIDGVSRSESPEVRALVERLRLAPHPEGGFYREIWRSATAVAHLEAEGDTTRAAGTGIYFLLPAGHASAFHRVRISDEVWHLLDGGALELLLLDDAGRLETRLLTTDLERGEPCAVVPAGRWQAARPGPGVPYALASCTVAPGFDFADFEMPAAEELARRFPAHEALVRSLAGPCRS